MPVFTAISSAWLFLLLIPLVAFYFLKLKRPRLEISSLVLWRQVLNDQRVNSPFQRFKRNLLLLLQILLLTLLILAAMQPLLRGRSYRAVNLPILIDCSASMAAMDKEGGTSRLAIAKKKVREIIDALPSDQSISLLAFSKNTRRLTEFTNDKTVLRNALEGLEVEDVPSDLEDALRTAQALARTVSFDKILLFSDGNFPARANFELSFQIDFQRIPEAGPNFGITACSARRATGGNWEVFVQLAGSSQAESTSGTVELIQNGTAIAREELTLVKNSAPRLTFKVTGAAATSVEARLTTRGFDSLSSDNVAWVTLPVARPLVVYVPPGMNAVRHALSVQEGLDVYPRDGASLPASFDLVFAENEAGLLPSRVQCTIGFVPSELKELVTIETRNAVVVDWRRDSPLLQHVSFQDVILSELSRNAAGVTESSYADLGFEILAHGPQGPLIVAKQEGENLRIHLLFQTDRSTLPYRVGFPVFISNLVLAALQKAGLAEAPANPTGVLPSVSLGPNRAVQITGPGGFRRDERTNENGLLSGVPAVRTGEYLIAGGSNEPIRAGASLLSPAETSLAAIDQIEFNDRLRVTAATAPARTDRELWWPLACAAFGLLLIEWWFFQRRSGGSPAR